MFENSDKTTQWGKNRYSKIILGKLDIPEYE
jgi:hypothetical protein